MPLRWAASRRIEFDANGERAAGAIAYFWTAGTTTPITVYQDAGLSTPHEQDSSGGLSGDSAANSVGRWPEVWIPFSATAYRERVVSADGVQLWDTDNITRTDPVEEAADTVDDTQLLQTGDFVWRPASETRSGFVRANGRTIGSATSGATERANADTEDLFTFLWNKLANSQAAVGGGRGASAAADWASNKAIAIPDMRGGVPRGLDDMGNSAASSLPAQVPFTNGNATTAGSLLGLNTHTILTASLPAYTPGGTVNVSGTVSFASSTKSVTFPAGTITATVTEPNSGNGHKHTGGLGTVSVQSDFVRTGGSTGVVAVNTADTQFAVTGIGVTFSQTLLNAGPATFNQNVLSATWAQATGSNPGGPNVAFVGTAQGGTSTPINVTSKSILGTWYIKL